MGWTVDDPAWHAQGGRGNGGCVVEQMKKMRKAIAELQLRAMEPSRRPTRNRAYLHITSMWHGGHRGAPASCHGAIAQALCLL
ncbi:hypothetical protein HAX54_049727, partial [Datura stramonium]|nr:hypothetical protein [Datura stramonium]